MSRRHPSSDGPFLEPAALTLAWASGRTLSVAMAGVGAWRSTRSEEAREGKEQRSLPARPSWVVGVEVLEEAGTDQREARS